MSNVTRPICVGKLTTLKDNGQPEHRLIYSHGETTPPVVRGEPCEPIPVLRTSKKETR